MSATSNKPTRSTNTKSNKSTQTPKSKDATLAQPEVSVAIIDEATLQDKIYTIRGQQVMLDFDLAEIYGYTTKRFNEQVQRNIGKFDSDFMFQLNSSEIGPVSSRSQNATLNKSDNKRGSNIKYLPYAFTEQGIYMLMTVLRGPLAVEQSKTLIRLFKAMKDHLVRQHHSDLDGLVILSEQTTRNTQAIDRLQDDLSSVKDSISEDIKTLTATTANTATELAHTNARLEERSTNQTAATNKLAQSIATTNQALKENSAAIESTNQKVDAATLTLSTFMASFGKAAFPTEFVILQGETLEARVAFQQLYSQAKHSVIVIDNYLGLNTLLHLRHVPAEVNVYIFSDNKGTGITSYDLAAFQGEYPAVNLELRSTNGVFHDRFIILDHGFEDERIFLCGASSKDAGRKVSVLVQLSTMEPYATLIEQLFSNPLLKLK